MSHLLSALAALALTRALRGAGVEGVSAGGAEARAQVRVGEACSTRGAAARESRAFPRSCLA